MGRKFGRSKVFSKEYLEARFNRMDIAELLNIIDTDMRTVALSLNKSLKMLGRERNCKGHWVYMYWNKNLHVYAFIARRYFHINHWTYVFKGAPTMTYGEALRRLQTYLREGKIELKEEDIFQT